LIRDAIKESLIKPPINSAFVAIPPSAMKQSGLTTSVFVKKPKLTKRQLFLQEMEQVVALIAPH